MRALTALMALTASVLTACPGPTEDPPALDLTTRLGAGEVRAGVITDDDALFAGISAEGQLGDIKIYNDRVQFVIQGYRDGDYWVADPGMVVDADIVRPEGVLGRDMVDEWGGMYGAARMLRAETVTVIDNGRSGRAVVRVEGPEGPLRYINGALEDPEFIPELGLHITTDYILEPGSWFLEVRSTIRATDETATIRPGDALFGAMEVADLWVPGNGLNADASNDLGFFSGYVGKRNDAAFGIFPEPGVEMTDGGLGFFGFLLDISAGFADEVVLEPGDRTTFTRYYAVGPDLATLTDTWLSAQGPTDEVSGVVTADDGPVAGARVNVIVDGLPYTVAFTRDDGSWTAKVPQGATVDLVADGRGPGYEADHPVGAVPMSPFASASVQAAALAALAEGAAPVPLARGRGIDTEPPLTLGVPGRLSLSTNDGLPFEVMARFTEADPAVDHSVVLERPAGMAALAWARDGALTLEVEPGTYDVTINRGARYSLHRETVTVAAGAETTVTATLTKAYEHPGWLLGDPHLHASPSPDGKLPMEDRLAVCAGRGLQLHFGTDHDAVGDYNPLIEAQGYGDIMGTVIAQEVSPVVRGHLNIYPIQRLEGLGNGGAWRWYAELVPDTQTEFDLLRTRDDPFLIQTNHPLAPGLASAAGWRPGYIDNPSKWTDDFDAIEVLNGTGYSEALPFYFDMINRGILVTPTGTTDSHGYTGAVGFSGTWLGIGTDDPTGYTDEALLEVYAARRTVVSLGVFLDLSIDPGSVITTATDLVVSAHTAPYSAVDRLVLYRDGAPIETVQGDTATFTLDAEADASFVVIAEGDTSFSPVISARPWAMSSAILLDRDADGWDPPLPPLTMNDDE